MRDGNSVMVKMSNKLLKGAAKTAAAKLRDAAAVHDGGRRTQQTVLHTSFAVKVLQSRTPSSHLISNMGARMLVAWPTASLKSHFKCYRASFII